MDSTQKDWLPKYGFHTNQGSKDMILSTLRAGLRDDQFIERQGSSCDEYEWFERKKDGSLGAIDGKNDDKVISRSGAYWLAMKYMPPVKLIPYVTPEERREKRKSRNTIISEATM